MLRRLSGILSMLLALGLGALAASSVAAGPGAESRGALEQGSAVVRDTIAILLRRLEDAVTHRGPLPHATPDHRRTPVVRLSPPAGGAGRFALLPIPAGVPKRVTPAPVPIYRPKRAGAPFALTKLVRLGSAPFPYDGSVPGRGAFLDVLADGRRGHRARRGHVLWADETFGDSRSLLHIPIGFDPARPGVVVLFFHGHGATLTRDVWHRQHLPQQLSAAETNAVLVAPQFAVDAPDSSIGKFWQPGGLRAYLDEIAGELAALYGKPGTRAAFGRMPVVIVAYSGGFVPAAWAIKHGDVAARLRGLVILDGLYGHADVFSSWVQGRPGRFLINAYGASTRRRSQALEQQLRAGGIRVLEAMPGRLSGGEIVSLATPVPHRHYVSMAWTGYPITDLLRRVTLADPVPPLPRTVARWR